MSRRPRPAPLLTVVSAAALPAGLLVFRPIIAPAAHADGALDPDTCKADQGDTKINCER